MKYTNSFFLPAEWEEQAFIQLTWPDETTDWKDIILYAKECFSNIAQAIAQREPLLIVAQNPQEVLQYLKDVKGLTNRILQNIFLIRCPINDTWARDHAFLTCTNANGEVLLSDFRFNGWGNKFEHSLDNKINHNIFPNICMYYSKKYKIEPHYNDANDFVLEGGSIEVDGNGTLMTTSSCILNANRNSNLSETEIFERLKSEFGVSNILVLRHGHLEGDDTDGHIDTLARFCPNNVITYVCSSNPNDEHHKNLKAMEEELQTFTNAFGEAYTLIPLPMPNEIRDKDGQRLPATYANFTIINDAILMPTYGQEENDQKAKEQIQKAFPNYDIILINCNALIHQHGSLHCSTMQYSAPKILCN